MNNEFCTTRYIVKFNVLCFIVKHFYLKKHFNSKTIIVQSHFRFFKFNEQIKKIPIYLLMHIFSSVLINMSALQ